ncbi:MAG TPA: hypothetical protein VMS17_09470 [Gemmataceae bacterium]|nr:hypothetical protein [Gemmataceae bacterium]
MAIRFLCTHCKKVVTVKDEFAGKKGKCPHCKEFITVPTPAAQPAPPSAKPADGKAAPPPAPPAPPKPAMQPLPPPPGPTDIEAEAAAALADEPKPETVAATTIDFACPMCDAQLHMPVAEAGKRTPCPECRRIIKVPEPAKRDPTNWRQTGPALPSGAKREEVAAPEGAWGSTTAAATVSRESLQEAGAVPVKRPPMSRSRRIIRYAVWSLGGLVVFGCLVLGYLKWRGNRADQGVETAVAYADSDPGKTELGGAGRAALYRLAGEYALRAAEPTSGKRAHDLIGKSLAAAKLAAEPERDALLYDLALAEVELGGPQPEVDAGRKVAWDEVSKDLVATLDAMQTAEPKLDALRGVARRLAEQKEGPRAKALASAVFPAVDRAEAFGLVGLQLAAAKDDQAAADLLKSDVEPLYAGKTRPYLAPAAVALAVVLGQAPIPPAKESANDAVNASVGQVEGLARKGQWELASRSLATIPNDRPDARLRAYVELVAAEADDKTSGNPDIADAKNQISGAASPWLLLRLTRIGERAKVAADALQPIADKIADRDLHARGQLAVLKARLADPKQAGDPKLVDGVEAKTTSAWLARAEWARRNSGAAGVVKSWDGANHAFGLLGLALGEQGAD